MTDASTETLTQLGAEAGIASSPDDATIETVANPHPDTAYLVRFTCPEFTAICPVTGQPDFAHLVIDYVPDARLVESKSLKLFLAAFRNHGAFHSGGAMSPSARVASNFSAKPASVPLAMASRNPVIRV